MIMAIDSLNRKISFVAIIFVFVGVILGVIALTTNYWTVDYMITPSKAIETENGTLLVNEKLNQTWNVSSYFLLLFETD